MGLFCINITCSKTSTTLGLGVFTGSLKGLNRS
jgi:hypothetical protein